jgi:hypothetical protein
MSDAQEIILILAFLYFTECWAWIRIDTGVFRSWGTRLCSSIQPATVLGNDRGGLLFLNPLPPFGSLFLCREWPLSIDREGISTQVTSSIGRRKNVMDAGASIRFADVRGIWHANGDVLINGETILSLGVARAADHFAGLLTTIWKANPAEREGLIDIELARVNDLQAARTLFSRYRSESARLRFFCHVMFILLFGLLPVAVFLPVIHLYWPEAAVASLLCLVVIVRTFSKVHKQLFPGDVAQRRKAILTMLLAPTSSVRACDRLSQHLLGAFDPMTTAAVVCDDVSFRLFARRALLALRYPAPRTDALPDQATERAFDQKLNAAFEEVVKEQGIDPAELTSPPARADETCRSYCPRCDTQFVTDGGVCVDCGGIPLVAFAESERDTSPTDAEVSSTGPSRACYALFC